MGKNSKDKRYKIIYFGFDLLFPVLESLKDSPCEIVKIFSCEVDGRCEFNDKVKAFAEENALPITMDKPSREELAQLSAEGVNFGICGGYYHRIPVLDELPIINIHGALLPKGRGPWPIAVTLLRGDCETGVTLHRISEKMDAGDILLQERIAVSKNENQITLTKKICDSSVALVRSLVENFDEMNQLAKSQDEKESSYWRSPEEKDWTVTAAMTAEERTKILRAFAGFDCIYESCGLRCEFVSGIEPETAEVELDQMDLVDEIRRTCGNNSTAHCFQNFFMWRKRSDIRLYLEKDCFSAKYGGEVPVWTFPVGSTEGKMRFIAQLISVEKAWKIQFCSKEDIDFLNEYFPGMFRISETPEFHEYLYDLKSYAALSGGKYMRIRGRVHRIERDFNPTIIKITEENLDFAKEVYQGWLVAKHTSFREDNTCIVEEYLNNWSKMKAEGILVMIDGKPMAAIAGFPLDDDYFDYSLSCTREKIGGLSDYAKHALAQQISDRYKFINGEEDMGLEGLRQMKQLMRPISLLKQYEAVYER